MSASIAGLVMLSLFVALVLGAYVLARKLRASGYGPRLDALHARTIRLQIAVLRLFGAALRRPGSRPPVYPQNGPSNQPPETPKGRN
ncbi:MAG: hypothetical protein PHT60_15855 [Acidiphilium sp.]|nr:hypothetical protein [Acidiphilium sp.]MDD4937238.1 hypothetical protein [Acidiphilium sp.]